MAASTLKELREMSDDDLIAAHDHLAKTGVTGFGYYIDELARRDQTRQTEAMLNYTRAIVWMTIIITIATIANLVIAYVLLRKQP